MSIILACGAECGIAVVGTGTAGLKHWDTVSGAVVAIESSIVRSGGKSYKIPAAVGGFSGLRRSLSASQTAAYVRGYFRLNNITPSTSMQVLIFGVAAGANPNFAVSTSGVLSSANWGTGQTIQLAADTWYGIECELDVSANPNVIKWRFWDGTQWVAKTDITKAQSATTISTVDIACWGPTATNIVYWDDVLIGQDTATGNMYSAATSKGGKVLRYRPNADGTHSFTAGDFGYNGAGADVATNATDVSTYLDDDDQTGLTDFIRQKVIRNTGYVEVAFEDEPSETIPRVVAVTSTHHASSTGADTFSVKASADGFSNSTAILTDEDVSDTTIHPYHVVMSTAPGGAAWTTSLVNAITVRGGYSTDVTDVPYWDTVSLEVEWTEGGSAAGGKFPSTGGQYPAAAGGKFSSTGGQYPAAAGGKFPL